MSRAALHSVVGLEVSVLFSAGLFDLPSLAPERSTSGARYEVRRSIGDGALEALKRALRFGASEIDYEMMGPGVKANFRYHGTPVTAQIGYLGEHYLELSGMFDGKVRFAVGADRATGAYRIEYRLDF